MVLQRFPPTPGLQKYGRSFRSFFVLYMGRVLVFQVIFGRGVRRGYRLVAVMFWIDFVLSCDLRWAGPASG